MSLKPFMLELLVSAISSSVQWYTHFLGHPPVLSDPVTGFTLFEMNFRLALLPGQPTPGGVRFCLETDSLERELKRLAEVDIEPREAVKESPEGYRRVIFADPDGYEISLFEWVN